MRGHLLVALVALATGCGETQLGPFQPLPIDARFDVQGNDGVIHIARDRHGIVHVYALTYRDLGFAQGYVMAHDRLAQMEMLRRFASGTLAEIYGVSDPSTIELDKQMRFHQLRRYSEDVWGELRQRATPRDQQVADLLERFADGVNAYVADAPTKWPLDPAIRDAGLEPLFAPTLFMPWTPVDSIAIMRLFTFSQSWTVPEELDLTEIDVKVRRFYPAALARDLLAIAPIPKLGSTTAVTPAGTAAAANRPTVPDGLLASARAFFAGTIASDPARVLGPHAFLRPFIGSTAMVVGGEYTREQLETPKVILAADMQLAPSNPATFYPMHQIIGGERAEDALQFNVLGLMLPGVPIAIAGTNGQIGWAPTLGTHDVNDIYLEDLTRVDVTRVEEVIRIGNFGDVSSSETVSYEFVPRGPLVPGHPPDRALSIAYTGYAVTHELAVLWDLGSSRFDVDLANRTLRQLRHGPHFMLVDASGGYAWASNADVPVRTIGALSWSVASPDAAAPFFVLDGTNPAHDWAGFAAIESLPFRSAREPYIVIADSDPIAAT
nr:penicillin acylase family protein [Deltaproteobacteria bacterium]